MFDFFEPAADDKCPDPTFVLSKAAQAKLVASRVQEHSLYLSVSVLDLTKKVGLPRLKVSIFDYNCFDCSTVKFYFELGRLSRPRATLNLSASPGGMHDPGSYIH